MALHLAPRNSGSSIDRQFIDDWDYVIRNEYGLDYAAKIDNGTPELPRVRESHLAIDLKCANCNTILPKMAPGGRFLTFLREAHVPNGALYCSIDCYARLHGPRMSRTEIPDDFFVVVCRCRDGVTRVRTIYQPLCDCGSAERDAVETYTAELAAVTRPLQLITSVR